MPGPNLPPGGFPQRGMASSPGEEQRVPRLPLRLRGPRRCSRDLCPVGCAGWARVKEKGALLSAESTESPVDFLQNSKQYNVRC